MSNDDDNLMSCADGGHVLESEDARKSRLSRDRQRKHRKLHPRRPRTSRPSRPVSALTDEDLERKRTQDRASQRRCREKKKHIAAAKIEAQRHAGNIDTHDNVDVVPMGDNGSDNNEASIDFCAKHSEPKAEDIRCVCKVTKTNANGKGVFPNVPK
jgi:hypothetical protein